MFVYGDKPQVLCGRYGTVRRDGYVIVAVSDRPLTPVEAIHFYQDVVWALPNGWADDPAIFLTDAGHIEICGTMD